MDNYSLATVALETLDHRTIRTYNDYWKSISPEDEGEYFRRWLFAFTSVHTTWEANVRGYMMIRDFHQWLENRNELERLLIEARCGMHSRRAQFIWDFAQDFWQHTAWYYQGQGESWGDWRDRLVGAVKGLGMAKVSFALEMSFPVDVEVVCLDVHMLKTLNMPVKGNYNNPNKQEDYKVGERAWLKACTERDMPSYTARCAYWDTIQKQQDSRYWSWVFETAHA